MKGQWLHSIGSLRLVICLSFVVFSVSPAAKGQVVTIDFDYSNQLPAWSNSFPFPSGSPWRLPWREDGFVVGSTNLTDFARIVGTVPPRGGSPPYPGFLTLFGLRGISAVTITNEASLTFDLLSVDVLTVGLGLNSPTNYATISSSAGGRFNLLGTPDGTTVQFPEDSQWQNLTFLRIEFVTRNYPADGLQLDNLVLRTSVVPEPSVLALFGSAAFAMILARRRSTVLIALA